MLSRDIPSSLDHLVFEEKVEDLVKKVRLLYTQFGLNLSQIEEILQARYRLHDKVIAALFYS